MRRDQLEHAIRTACQIAGLTEVIIVGSQAILGTYREDELPFYATQSAEVDVILSLTTTVKLPASQTRSKGWRVSSHRLRSSTGSASTEWTSALRC
jgi:hypothetical protein